MNITQKPEAIIFYNRGGSGQGKTTSLKNLAALIAEKYPSEINDTQNIEKINITDIRCIREIAQVRIGIFTQGDPNTPIKSELLHLKEKGCTIFACCTRTDGKTRDDVLEFAKENQIHAIEWRNLRSPVGTMQNTLNVISAELFLQTIEAYVLGRF